MPSTRYDLWHRAITESTTVRWNQDRRGLLGREYSRREGGGLTAAEQPHLTQLSEQEIRWLVDEHEGKIDQLRKKNRAKAAGRRTRKRKEADALGPTLSADTVRWKISRAELKLERKTHTLEYLQRETNRVMRDIEQLQQEMRQLRAELDRMQP